MMLHAYAKSFNSVENNSFFYHLPKLDSVKRWADDVDERFKFIIKVPQVISHDLLLHEYEKHWDVFLGLLSPLKKSVGMIFLQLPERFTPMSMPLINTWVDKCRQAGYEAVVEVRNIDFYDAGHTEHDLDDMLLESGASRAYFLTEMLHGLEANSPEIVEAQRKKPKMPDRSKSVGKYPMLRFVGSNDIEMTMPRLENLAQMVKAWIIEGKHPYCFIHSPGDLFAPELAKKFYEILEESYGISWEKELILPGKGEIEEDPFAWLNA